MRKLEINDFESSSSSYSSSISKNKSEFYYKPGNTSKWKDEEKILVRRNTHLIWYQILVRRSNHTPRTETHGRRRIIWYKLINFHSHDMTVMAGVDWTGWTTQNYKSIQILVAFVPRLLLRTTNTHALARKLHAHMHCWLMKLGEPHFEHMSSNIHWTHIDDWAVSRFAVRLNCMTPTLGLSVLEWNGQRFVLLWQLFVLRWQLLVPLWPLLVLLRKSPGLPSVAPTSLVRSSSRTYTVHFFEHDYVISSRP